MNDNEPKEEAVTEHISRTADSTIEITEKDCPEKLGFAFSTKKKWIVLTVIALVQTSMNLNASIYGNAIKPLAQKYEVQETQARLGMSMMLIFYAFGCELWAPWSEELGRKKVLQWSLFLVNVCQLPPLFATAFAGKEQASWVIPLIIAWRAMLGLCSAGGSVTLGMVADMWGPNQQQEAMAFVVLSSVGGSIVGPILGGFLEHFCDVHWIFVAQFVIGAVVQLVHYFGVPETRSRVLVAREAKRRRAEGQTVISAYEKQPFNFLSKAGFKECCRIWFRPFKMFAIEPIVLSLSLISGFSDALIFSFLESLGMVTALWEFKPWQTGLAFIPIGLGYLIAYLLWLFEIKLRNKAKAQGKELSPESRLRWLLWTAPLLPLAMFPFAWLGTGPPKPWIVPLLFLVPIGVANYAIYGATVDYMVAAYGAKYSASATGGNGFARDLLAGCASFWTHGLYTQLGSDSTHLQWGSTLCGFIVIPLIIPIFVFYYSGPWFRKHSRYANEVLHERLEEEKQETVV